MSVRIIDISKLEELVNLQGKIVLIILNPDLRISVIKSNTVMMPEGFSGMPHSEAEDKIRTIQNLVSSRVHPAVLVMHTDCPTAVAMQMSSFAMEVMHKHRHPTILKWKQGDPSKFDSSRFSWEEHRSSTGR